MKDDIYNNIDYSFKPTKTDDPPFSPHGGMDFIPSQIQSGTVTLNTYPVKESIARAEILTIGRIKDLRLKRITKWFSKYDKDSKIGNIIIDICFDHYIPSGPPYKHEKLSNRLACLSNYINTCPYKSDITILIRGYYIIELHAFIISLPADIPVSIRKNVLDPTDSIKSVIDRINKI